MSSNFTHHYRNQNKKTKLHCVIPRYYTILKSQYYYCCALIPHTVQGRQPSTEVLSTATAITPPLHTTTARDNATTRQRDNPSSAKEKGFCLGLATRHTKKQKNRALSKSMYEYISIYRSIYIGTSIYEYRSMYAHNSTADYITTCGMVSRRPNIMWA